MAHQVYQSFGFPDRNGTPRVPILRTYGPKMLADFGVLGLVADMELAHGNGR